MRPSKPPSRSASAAFAPARLAPTITNVRSSLISFLSPYSCPDEGQELLARPRVVSQQPVQRRSHRARAGLLHAAQRHAHVLGLEHHADALRRQVLLEP